MKHLSTNTLYRSTLLGLFLVFSCHAHAWNEGKPDGAQFYPEQSQESIAKDQVKMKAQGEVGIVEHGKSQEVAPNIEHDSDAANQVSEATADSGKATQPLIEAERQLKEEKQSKNGFYIWGSLFSILGFGVVLAARQWANKNIPEMPRTTKTKW